MTRIAIVTLTWVVFCVHLAAGQDDPISCPSVHAHSRPQARGFGQNTGARREPAFAIPSERV